MEFGWETPGAHGLGAVLACGRSSALPLHSPQLFQMGTTGSAREPALMLVSLCLGCVVHPSTSQEGTGNIIKGWKSQEFTGGCSATGGSLDQALFISSGFYTLGILVFFGNSHESKKPVSQFCLQLSDKYLNW